MKLSFLWSLPFFQSSVCSCTRQLMCVSVCISGRGTEQGVRVTQQSLHTGSPLVWKRNWMSYRTVPVLPSLNVWPLNASRVLWEKIVSSVLVLALQLPSDFNGRKLLVICNQNLLFFSPLPICLFFSLSYCLLLCTNFFPICSGSSNCRSGLQMWFDLHEFLVKVEQEEVGPS